MHTFPDMAREIAAAQLERALQTSRERIVSSERLSPSADSTGAAPDEPAYGCVEWFIYEELRGNR